MMDSIYLTYPIPTHRKDKNRASAHGKTSDIIVMLMEGCVNPKIFYLPMDK